MATRKCLSFRDKKKVLEDLDKGGKSKEQIAREHGIVIGYVYRIIRQRAEIESYSATGSDRKSKRSSQYPEIEEQLLCWLRESAAMGMQNITGPMIKDKAIEIAISLGNYKFPASNGWLENFRKRFQLSKDNQISAASQRAIVEGDPIEPALIPARRKKLKVSDDPTDEEAREAYNIIVKYLLKRKPPFGTFLAMQQIGECINPKTTNEPISISVQNLGHKGAEEEEVLLEEAVVDEDELSEETVFFD